MASRRIFAVLVILTMTSLANTSNFLFLLPLCTLSHHLYLTSFWENLTSRGHHVTLITGTSQFHMENVSIIYLRVPFNIARDLNAMVYTHYKRQPLFSWLELEKQFGLRICKIFCDNKNLLELINNGTKYDVVFVTAIMEDCTFPIASFFSDKIVYINFPRHFSPVYTYSLGISAPYSFVPHVMSHLTSTMSLSQRMWNALASGYHVFVLREYSEQEKIIKSYFPNASDIITAISKVSLVFTNSDNVFSEPVPSLNYIIKIGGMQCRNARLLSKSYEKILSNSSGFVLFSLGTVVEMTNAGKETLQAFIDAFAMLKETVVWKTKEKYENLPPNVKIFSTIPQQDILGHSNLRLFISQGGLFSLQEALYNAVPVLGIPLMIDQYGNMKRVEELGYGKQLDLFGNLTKDDIYSAIRIIIDDARFKKQATYYSTIFKDVDVSPLSRAIFWTEWLTRHPSVSVLRQPFLEMNLIQYFMLDAILFLFCVLITPLILIIFIYKIQ